MMISPSDKTWSDLAEYIKEINGPDVKNKSVSRLVSMDSVAASRFVNIKFKSMIEFLKSPAALLCETNYFWGGEGHEY